MDKVLVSCTKEPGRSSVRGPLGRLSGRVAGACPPRKRTVPYSRYAGGLGSSQSRSSLRMAPANQKLPYGL